MKINLAEIYTKHVNKMYERIAAWALSNPGRPANITFLFPPDVVVACTIKEALQLGLIRADENGRELLTAIGVFDVAAGEAEPTVLMLQCALDLKAKDKPV